jgi:hypothetical protein
LKSLALVSDNLDLKGQNTRQNTFRDESDRRKMLQTRRSQLGNKKGNYYAFGSTNKPKKRKGSKYGRFSPTRDHTVHTHVEKDKDGNEIITETHTITDTHTELVKPGENISHPKGPQIKKIKTDDGWIEEITTFETVEVPVTVPETKKANGWSQTHTGKGWNSFKKKNKKKSKKTMELKNQFSAKKKKHFNRFSSKKNTEEDNFSHKVISENTTVRNVKAEPLMIADDNHNSSGFGNE